MSTIQYKKSRKKAYFVLGGLVVAVLVAALVLWAVFGGGSGNTSAAMNIQTPPTASATPTPLATAEQCAATWPITTANHTDNRWFYEGISSIRDATTNEEATAAAYDWQEKVRSVPYLQAAAAKVFLQRDVDPATLTGSDGCVTQAAVDLDLEIGMTLASSKIVPADAPETGYNTGVENNQVVSDSSPGVSGDRKAVQITTADGRTIWVMARCGNIVTDSPNHPPGKTDNPPKPTCPPDMPHGEWPVCKDDPSNDPGPNGNAPIGNGPNYDPGPGEYIPPSEMEQPPSTPRENPAPPAPEPPAQQPSTPSNPEPAPVPTKDPAPPPPPQPSAPAPSAPETGCDPSAPGGTDCG